MSEQLHAKLEQCRKLMLAADTFEQGDAFDNVFAAWCTAYFIFFIIRFFFLFVNLSFGTDDCAKVFAKGNMSRREMNEVDIQCCSALLALHLPAYLRNANTDDYVVRNMVRMELGCVFLQFPFFGRSLCCLVTRMHAGRQFSENPHTALGEAKVCRTSGRNRRGRQPDSNCLC